MADNYTFLNQEKPGMKLDLGVIPDGMPRGVSQCLCSYCLKFNKGISSRSAPLFSDYNEIYIERTEKLSEHQYLLCMGSIWAYIFKLQSWRK